MLRTSDGETEILLGNKQLLGIFFVVAILLGVAFAGGYKVGQGSKKTGYAATVADQQVASPLPASTTAQETHAVPPETSTQATGSDAAQTQPVGDTEPPLGSPSKKIKASNSKPAEDSEAPGPPAQTAESQTVSGASFTPQPGQMFLQVVAASRDEAEAIADVLRKKNFRAHAVPKPGSTKLYRVIIGPIRDATDLSNTRASLRNTGFREIIVQKY
jgi:hypothetical protein